MSDEVQGVTADSPPVDTPADSGQAPSAPVAAAKTQTVPYERFQQVNSQMRQYQQQAQQHAQALQQLQQEIASLKKTASGPARTPEESFQRQQAQQALRELLADDPDLKHLLDLAKQAPHLLRTPQAVQQFTEATAQQQARAAESHIKGLAKDAGLSNDPKFLTRLTRAVALEAAALPGGRERFDAGDMSVLDEAFAALKGDFAKPAAAASVVQTKQNVRNLPPRTVGGGPGREPEPTLASVGGDERKFTSTLRQRAAAMREALGG